MTYDYETNVPSGGETDPVKEALKRKLMSKLSPSDPVYDTTSAVIEELETMHKELCLVRDGIVDNVVKLVKQGTFDAMPIMQGQLVALDMVTFKLADRIKSLR